MTLPNLNEMIAPFYYCLHFVNGSLSHVGPPYCCCCYYYYYYCRFCTVSIAGFLVLHSTSPFSLFVLYSLFPPHPPPHSLSKQLLPFPSTPELVTQVSPMCQGAPHREGPAFVVASRSPLCCHCRECLSLGCVYTNQLA